MSSPSETTVTSIKSPNATFTKGTAFWLSYVSLILSTLLSAMDLTAVSTALPTITNDLNGGDKFVWIGSAYALASTAILPLSGTLANIFGRRPVMLGAILFFSLGSALCGSAQNMDWLIAARTVQGIGGGAILNLTEIIVSDLVPLSQRGAYQGFIVMTWAFASAIGPPIGGSLAEKASWRWLFYINLPLTAIAFVFVLIFLRVKTPAGRISDKLARVDWFGNVLIIAGTTLSNLALAWAGVRYAWSSVQVLTTLILGLALIAAFIGYEKFVPREPTIPWEVLSNRTTLSAFAGTLIHGITSISLVYYMPVYFQSVLAASPIQSGVDLLPAALLIAPFGLVNGITTQVFKRYVPGNYAGWILSIVGFGILSLLSSTSSTRDWIGFQIVAAIGLGVLYSATIFPTLASVDLQHTASALAFYSFMRSFAQTWGITISATILQNELKDRLPAAFTSQFPSGVEIAYAAIPQIPSLPTELQAGVKAAFADSLSIVWKVMIGISGLGLLSVLVMKEIPMRDVTDDTYTLEAKKGGDDREKSVTPDMNA